jgi:hypothetical protein
MSLLIALLLLPACKEELPEWCLSRADDADCDGSPDAWDRCPESPFGDSTDRLGCTEGQAARCSISPVEPDNKAKLDSPATFRWAGDCDVYLLQFSDDPAFPPGGTRTALKTTGKEVSADGTEAYWRVVGGLTGSSSGAQTPPREIKKWR